MIPIVTLIPFLVTAAVLDFRKEKIPNLLSTLCFISGIVIQFIKKGTFGIGLAVMTSILLLILTYFLYLFGALGAGDCKLLAAAGTYFSIQIGIFFLILSLLIGAVISFGKLLFLISHSNNCRTAKIHFALPILLSGAIIIIKMTEV